jgi:multidrug efflux pump subunit AcrB
MPAMIGMVMLMGLVTKNAILLVDMTNQHVREGLRSRRRSCAPARSGCGRS